MHSQNGDCAAKLAFLEWDKKEPLPDLSLIKEIRTDLRQTVEDYECAKDNPDACGLPGFLRISGVMFAHEVSFPEVSDAASDIDH